MTKLTTAAANITNSQRQQGFRGGIPQGLSATSPSSRALETITMEQLRSSDIARAASEGIVWRKGYKGEELKKLYNSKLVSTLGGLSPDGGIFEDASTKLPVLSFECKFQGLNGNAIERWFKNYAVLQRLGIKRYVTFCLGDGFWTGSAEKIMAVAASLEADREHLWDDPEDIKPEQKLFLYRFSSVAEAAAGIGPLVESFVSLAINDKQTTSQA